MIALGAVIFEAEEKGFGHKAEEYLDWVLKKQCIKERILPADVAELVYFFEFNSSDKITSQNFAIDRGWLLFIVFLNKDLLNPNIAVSLAIFPMKSNFERLS